MAARRKARRPGRLALARAQRRQAEARLALLTDATIAPAEAVDIVRAFMSIHTGALAVLVPEIQALPSAPAAVTRHALQQAVHRHRTRIHTEAKRRWPEDETQGDDDGTKANGKHDRILAEARST